MKSPIVILVIFALASLVGGSSFAQSSKKTDINSAYQLKVGDYAALVLPEMLKLYADQFDAPVSVTYEPDKRTIDAEILGRRGTAEKAKETIKTLMDFLHAAHVPYVQRRFGVTLTDQDYRIFYYDRTQSGGPKLILRYVGGQYQLP